ncbi:hypothetical protein JTB14_022339 [Gonioctena quinquepunctata]|nr:hypothetical protein JTB14_022339 [Gonioctena quinquepunctata]
MKRRYICLGALMKKICSETGLTGNEIRRRFREISKAYEVLHMIVQSFNEIHGKFVIILSTIPIIFLLQIFSFVVLAVREGSEWLTSKNMSNLPLGFMLMAYCITIILSCDSVEKCGSKLLTNCFILQTKTDRCFQEELIALSYLMEDLSPKFSASGFFTVNQGLLSAFFTTIASYLVIVLQFNLK